MLAAGIRGVFSAAVRKPVLGVLDQVRQATTSTSPYVSADAKIVIEREARAQESAKTISREAILKLTEKPYKSLDDTALIKAYWERQQALNPKK